MLGAAPYPALQLFVATAGVAAAFAMIGIAIAGAGDDHLPRPGDLWFLLIYPGLMLVFWAQERAEQKAG